MSSHRVVAGTVSLALLSLAAVGCGSSGVSAAARSRITATGPAISAKTQVKWPGRAPVPPPRAGEGAIGRPGASTPVSVATGSSPIVRAVLRQINAARAAAHLRPYSLSSGLMTSASRHTMVMARGCGLSHQCPGEAGLGQRISAAGVRWNAVGENIGEGGPEPKTTAAEIKMAELLTRSMLAEKPPNDGHRKNLLSSAFHRVGISVYRSGSGTVWMTQDFAN